MAVVAEYKGPFGGLNTDNPPVIIQPNEAAQCDNFMLRHNYIGTRLKIDTFLPAPPDGNACTGIFTCYNSATGTYYLYMTTLVNLYILNIGNTWSPGIGTTAIGGILNTNFVNALGNSYFVNGSGNVYQMSGITLTKATNLYGAQFIMELAQTLIICNTYEGGTNFPQRIRWCNAGNVTQWDPAVYVGAGFSDLLDVSDQITGTMTVGSVGYVMRKNGITQVTPTGNGIQPWNFNHLWATERGIGVFYPDTVAQFGALGILLAEDNVYTFTVSTLDTIADKTISEIVADINSNPYGVYASIFPRKRVDYEYFCYDIYINTQFGFIKWSYDLQAKNWVRTTSTGLNISARPNYVVATNIAF